MDIETLEKVREEINLRLIALANPKGEYQTGVRSTRNMITGMIKIERNKLKKNT